VPIEGDATTGYSVSGDLTYRTVPDAFEQQLQFASVTRMNLQNVERIDSAGLAMLVEWVCAARKQDKILVLEQIPDSLKSLIEVSGLTEVLTAKSE
jgi:phospholipid transport system transporter-binding protein